VKTFKLESCPELDALVEEIRASEESDPISLTRGNTEMAVIVSSAEYAAVRRLEESLLDKLDHQESEEILRDPKWIGWDQLQKQLKS
jgi:hypothetical protein